MLFSVGVYPTGSMADYYIENSYGEFLVTGVVTKWYRMPQTYAYYVNGQRGFGAYPQNAQKLTEDAVAAADPDVDFSQFDNDGPDGIPNSGDDDGMIDALFVVHAGPGYEQSGDPNDIHSHQWVTRNPPTVDGVQAYVYSMEPEDGKIGVFGHEFGHVLGLPDLYDYDYDSRGVGYWSMMAAGSWGNGGVTPVHFDGWCKIQLGFVNPVEPTSNVTGASIPNVEDNAVVYRLWKNGYPESQYFVVENRQQTGFDAFLPGEGLVIYHADDDIPNNDDQTHYKVAVEQADGLFDLENDVNSGDAGDPWPGTSNNRNFDSTSTPNSRDYTGADTQVGVLNISDSGMNMTADIVVETSPALMAYGANIEDDLGEESIDPGDTAFVRVNLMNLGLDATSVDMLSSTIDPLVTVHRDSVFYGNIDADSSAWGDTTYKFYVSPSCPKAHGVPFTLEKRASGGYVEYEEVYLGISDSLNFFEWDEDNVSPGYTSQWHLSQRQNHSPQGFVSWYCGSETEGLYSNYADAALYTRKFQLTGSSQMTFWHRMNAEIYNSSQAWDGAVIEISIDEGPWTQITPLGGYTHTIVDNPASPFPAGTPCFSGSFGWTQETIDLSALSGIAQIRFRFGSDGSVTMEGWYIDDVSLTDVVLTEVPIVKDMALLSSPRLGQNYPNPFNPHTTIEFYLTESSRVSLMVFDVHGRLVKKLADDVYGLGSWTVAWDGTDEAGRTVSGSVYFYRLQTDTFVEARKMVLAR
jgi:M6 family metalloprotease-like protein